MARVTTYKTRDGRVSYPVKWKERQPGPGPARWRDRTITLHDLTQAERFSSLVQACGERMPDDAQLAMFGFAWMVEDDPGAGAGEDEPLTVARLVNLYLRAKASSINAPAERTMRDYHGYVRNYVEPRPLAGLLAAEVEYRDIDQWQHELTTTIAPNGRKVLTRDSVAKVRAGVLAPAFKWANSPRATPTGPLLRNNPVPDAEIPATESTFDRDILESPAEYALFLTQAREVDPNWADMLETVAMTGQRFGEITALETTAVDPGRAVLYLRQRNSQGEILAGTKNGTTRPVPLPFATVERIILPRMARRGVLFTGPRGARWSYSTEWNRWDALRARLRTFGFTRHITHHCLRSGFASWLGSERVNEEKVRKVMGHVPKSMTGVYDKLTARDLAEIRDAMTKLLPTRS